MRVLDLSTMYSGFLDPMGLMVKSQTSSVFPLGVTVADLVSGNAGAALAIAARVYKAIYHGVWLMSFV